MHNRSGRIGQTGAPTPMAATGSVAAIGVADARQPVGPGSVGSLLPGCFCAHIQTK